MIKTDIIVIGAGPVGLFTIFEAGLMKLKCHVIDALPKVGGQLSEIYPKKPIYDIPGLPNILAGELINNLMKQVEPFHPKFTLGDRVERIKKHQNHFVVYTQSGLSYLASVIIIAGGLGSFEPRKPKIENLYLFEGKGVEYMVKNPEKFRNKKILISGGGDSALDWAIFFVEKEYAKSVILLHRSKQFRAHKDSINKIYKLQKNNKIRIITDAEVFDLYSKKNDKNSDILNYSIASDDLLQCVKIKYIQLDNKFENLYVDYWLPLFGFSPKLGPISTWGLNIDKNAIIVNNALDYQTNIPGIFAVGDINTYPGKLKLILCGFHEATLAVQKAYKIINPNKNFIMKYTTVNGIQELN